jgi:hypothetical protein
MGQMGMGGLAPPAGRTTYAHLLPGGLLLLSFGLIPFCIKNLPGNFCGKF